MRMGHHGKSLIIRSFRTTYVLAFLFAFSLLYFIIESGLLSWIIQNALNISGQDIEERMLDKYKLTAHRHIQWLADNAGRNTNAVNDSFVSNEGMACRNTIQGRTSVTDDRGYTCERAFLMSNGCCEVSAQSVRFSCAWCDFYTGCCSYYEQCVSCCLRPEQKNILLEMIESTSGHRLRQILSATDQFELCMLKCRTSSNVRMQTFELERTFGKQIQKREHEILLQAGAGSSFLTIRMRSPQLFDEIWITSHVEYTMNLPWHRQTILSTKNKLDLLLALEHGTEAARFWQSWRQVIVWALPTICFIFDILALQCAICTSLISWFLRYDRIYSMTYTVEITALFICFLNLLVCFFEAATYSYYITRKISSKLTSQQCSLRGSTNQSDYSISSSSSSNRNFITQWLSALQFGDWTAQTPKNLFSSNYTKHNLSSSIGSSFNNRKSGSTFDDSALFIHSTPLVSHHSSYGERHSSHSVPLSAKVGSRASFRSRPTSSIQTNKQLEEYLQKSPQNNELFQSVITSFSTSLGSLSFPQSERIIGISQSFRLASSKSNSYEVGTAIYDDEQGRVASDENSVVSLVTGSRIMVTDKRISLSPIPLNLIEVGSELTSEDGKGIASDGTDVTRNVDNDSITFRVNHNAAKRSPKKSRGFTPPLIRRSENYERRRLSSLSPHSPSGNQFSSVVQMNGIESSPTGKQIPITSSEILNQYRMDAEDFAVAEHNLRSWICQTILRPLIAKIDEINAIFIKFYSHLHLKIGHSSVEALQTAASSKNDLLKSALPYILPYLKTHEKQSYLIKRCRELSADICMRNYNWQGGGYEPIERKEEGEHGYSPTERAWGPHLLTDAQLIWSWFSVYMDTRMRTNPLVSDIETPFSSVFYLRKPAKPSSLQCMKKSFYIYQSSVHPPHFELVLDGGRERFEVDRGTKNLWRTILLFIQHIRLFNEGQLGDIKIDENGINLACVLE